MQTLDFIQLLTSSGTYVLALAVFILTWLLRRAVETGFPSLKKCADANALSVTYLTSMSRWWNEVILYILPVFIGGSFGLFGNSTFLFGDIKELTARVTLGGVVGWLSSFMYKVLRKVVKQRLGVDLVPGPDSTDSVPPPVGTKP